MSSEKKLTELKREDIIEAAASEFSANGFRATSMDRIAATARVSKRTVYNHFESKAVLFQAISQDMCDHFMQVSEHPYDPALPLSEQLRAIAEQQMAMLTSEDFISLVKMITCESLADPELTKTNLDEFNENGIGVVKWIKQAAKDGKLKNCNPVVAGTQFLALIEGFALWPQMYDYKPIPKKKEQKAIIESTVEMFLNTYAATD